MKKTNMEIVLKLFFFTFPSNSKLTETSENIFKYFVVFFNLPQNYHLYLLIIQTKSTD